MNKFFHPNTSFPLKSTQTGMFKSGRCEKGRSPLVLNDWIPLRAYSLFSACWLDPTIFDLSCLVILTAWLRGRTSILSFCLRAIHQRFSVPRA